jgi:chromate transport protein ChrA
MADAPERTGPPSPRPSALTAVFARYANTTFGGGSTTIAVLKESEPTST